MKYPNKLKEFRKANGLKQYQVTRLLGYTYEDWLSKWEKGIAVPHLINLLKLCTIYGVSAGDLYPALLDGWEYRKTSLSPIDSLQVYTPPDQKILPQDNPALT